MSYIPSMKSYIDRKLASATPTEKPILMFERPATVTFNNAGGAYFMPLTAYPASIDNFTMLANNEIRIQEDGYYEFEIKLATNAPQGKKIKFVLKPLNSSGVEYSNASETITCVLNGATNTELSVMKFVLKHKFIKGDKLTNTSLFFLNESGDAGSYMPNKILVTVRKI